MKKSIIIATIAMIAFLGVTAQASADSPIYTGTFNNKALNGYDAISYFLGDGFPVKGSENFQTEWKGADWYFISQENLDIFQSSPSQYAPQYGGYCAWAAAHGSLAKGDPLVYTLINDKVYLNYNKSINDGWLPRKAELITKADAQYLDLVDVK